MATHVDPRQSRPRTPVRNAPDARTLRTTETLLHQAVIADGRKTPEPAPAQVPLFQALQARYG